MEIVNEEIFNAEFPKEILIVLLKFKLKQWHSEYISETSWIYCYKEDENNKIKLGFICKFLRK